jgi:hypothetical protein
MKSPQKPNPLRQDLIISAVTLPTLALLFAARSATLNLVKIGIWSEELLRGDRAPLRSPVSAKSGEPPSS